MQSHRAFWQEHPALLWGLCLLISTGCPLYGSILSNLILLFCLILYLCALRFFSVLLLLLAGASYSYFLYLPAPQVLPEKVYFSISSLQPHQTPFEKGLLYKGSFWIEGKKYPGSVFHTGFSHPLAHQDYVLVGKVASRSQYEYSCKPTEWMAVDHTFSLAEWRYQQKEAFRTFLSKRLPTAQVSSFLSSLITGDVEDRDIRFRFNRLGLQHLLAISGFHFGLLLVFCTFFLNLFLPKRLQWMLLFLLLNGYFLFVGTSAAVQRSWLTAELYLLAKLFHRQTTGLNLLGVALCAELLLNPLSSSQLGFQLSYLSCLGILFLYAPFEQLIAQQGLPKRSWQERQALSFIAKHGALLSSFFRQAISISCAVNGALLPFLLYHFHQFPLLSLLYNLFIPFWIGIALFLLLLSLFIYLCLPPLASVFFGATDFLTRQILDLVSYPPTAIDFVVLSSDFPSFFLSLYVAALLFLGIYLHRKRQDPLAPLLRGC